MDMDKILKSLKQDAGKAGYRVATTQLTNAAKKAIVAVMQKQGGSSDNINTLSMFLDSEAGAALIAFALGAALPKIPQYGNNPHVEKIAEEFRIHSMTTVGNAVMNEVTQYLVPALSQVFSSLPEEEIDMSNITKTRLTDSSSSVDSYTESEAEEESETEGIFSNLNAAV